MKAKGLIKVVIVLFVDEGPSCEFGFILLKADIKMSNSCILPNIFVIFTVCQMFVPFFFLPQHKIFPTRINCIHLQG